MIVETKIDWLSVIFDISQEDENYQGYLNRIFGLRFDNELITKLSHGIYRFDNAVLCYGETVLIAWSNDDLLLQLSSQGLQEIDERIGLNHFLKCLDALDLDMWHVTRVDIAKDLKDSAKKYSPKSIYNERKKGNLVSKIKYYEFRESGKEQCPNLLTSEEKELFVGSTFYMGKNPFQVRIYNKLAERYAKLGVYFRYKSWYRWEIQINAEKSDFYFKKWRTEQCSLFEFWSYVMDSNFKFVRNHSIDLNKSRNHNKLQQARWWRDLLNLKDKWEEKPVLRRLQTPDRTQRTFKNSTVKQLSMYYAKSRAGYMKNGLSEYDASRVAMYSIINEIKNYLDAHETYYDSHDVLYSWVDKVVNDATAKRNTEHIDIQLNAKILKLLDEKDVQESVDRFNSEVKSKAYQKLNDVFNDIY